MAHTSRHDPARAARRAARDRYATSARDRAAWAAYALAVESIDRSGPTYHA